MLVVMTIMFISTTDAKGKKAFLSFCNNIKANEEMNAEVDISLKLDGVEVELSQEIVKKRKKFILVSFCCQSQVIKFVINIIVFYFVQQDQQQPLALLLVEISPPHNTTPYTDVVYTTLPYSIVHRCRYGNTGVYVALQQTSVIVVPLTPSFQYPTFIDRHHGFVTYPFKPLDERRSYSTTRSVGTSGETAIPNRQDIQDLDISQLCVYTEITY